MNYIKTIMLCVLLAFCVGCGSNEKTGNTESTDKTTDTKKTDETKTTEKTSTKEQPKATLEHAEEVKNTEATENTTDQKPESKVVKDIREIVQLHMEGWDLVPPKKWMDGEFQKAIDPENKLVYEKQILVKGDFNGDGKEDFACFVINKANETRLVVFHQNRDTYGLPMTVPGNEALA